VCRNAHTASCKGKLTVLQPGLANDGNRHCGFGFQVHVCASALRAVTRAPGGGHTNRRPCFRSAHHVGARQAGAHVLKKAPLHVLHPHRPSAPLFVFLHARLVSSSSCVPHLQLHFSNCCISRSTAVVSHNFPKNHRPATHHPLVGAHPMSVIPPYKSGSSDQFYL
jgi:hypothetical protein